MSLKRRIPDGEAVLFQLKKSKVPIVFMVVFMSVWLFFAYLFLANYWLYRFGAGSDMSPGWSVALAVAGLVIFALVGLALPISYFTNDLIITDRRIYIRRTTNTRILRLGDVRSFQHAYASGRNGKSNNRIYFYLFSGFLVKTGTLNISFTSLQYLLELLREKYEGRGFTAQELHRLAAENPAAGLPETSRSIVVPILMLIPAALALVIIADYLI
jgi:hypothetical protein